MTDKGWLSGEMDTSMKGRRGMGEGGVIWVRGIYKGDEEDCGPNQIAGEKRETQTLKLYTP